MPHDDTEKLVLSLLYRSRSKIAGKTKFQKIMYILKNDYQDRLPELKNLRFRLHYYGPFSRSFDDMLTRLTFHGDLFTEKKKVLDFLRNDYTLSARARLEARRFYAREDSQRRELINQMAEEMKRLNRETLQDVISTAYRIAEEKGL
jgi:uncharacterized protein YwgA